MRKGVEIKLSDAEVGFVLVSDPRLIMRARNEYLAWGVVLSRRVTTMLQEELAAGDREKLVEEIAALKGQMDRDQQAWADEKRILEDQLKGSLAGDKQADTIEDEGRVTTMLQEELAAGDREKLVEEIAALKGQMDRDQQAWADEKRILEDQLKGSLAGFVLVSDPRLIMRARNEYLAWGVVLSRRVTTMLQEELAAGDKKKLVEEIAALKGQMDRDQQAWADEKRILEDQLKGSLAGMEKKLKSKLLEMDEVRIVKEAAAREAAAEIFVLKQSEHEATEVVDEGTTMASSQLNDDVQEDMEEEAARGDNDGGEEMTEEEVDRGEDAE
ncbi:hypothetical protein DEO72_LG6g1364 [Vigna unguiculata]|uniref:Uncharacterized protein n=1 Tax=Vigna unguiculata TaxID=3917 RepID=A0A4D6M6Y7_VIGUN|nr:hypothetical protein DEO72_LG6g1364 [Vigna unguiculata]